MSFVTYHRYLEMPDGARIFTAVCLPSAEGTFPVVLCRSPYVDSEQELAESEVCERLADAHRNWLDGGYAVVYQHCRGRGKSSGDCIPYINEREDGLSLQDWIRNQPFYNG